MNYKDYFKDKKITVMRIGLLGRGVGDVKFLSESGAEILVVDDASREEMQPSVDALKGYPNIKFKFGPYDPDDFRNCDMVLKGAGTPLDSPEIAEAKKHNIPVNMSADLFAKLSPAKIVGVTGTRGKSTITQLIYEILKSSRSTSSGQAGRKTFLGGNVRGISTLAHLPESSEDEIAVLELDSWQLQGFGEEKISPDVAVFSNLMPDHLDYYKGNLDRYFEDKANIFKYQKPDNVLILGEQVKDLVEKKYPEHFKRAIIVGSENFPKDWQIKIPGEHNRYNISLAVEAARVWGVSDEDIKKAVLNFKGVSGRLELVKEVGGVKIYNDTTATTPQATLAALRALSESGIKNKELEKESIHNSKFLLHNSARIVLIMGGADKGLDMSELLKEIPKFCKAVVLLPGTGTERIGIRNKELGIKNGEPEFEIHNSKFLIQGTPVKSLPEALKLALEYAENGDIILFSPAFASFGPPPGGFKNEFDRGDQFKKAVEEISEKFD